MRKLWDSAAEDAGRRGKAAAQPGGAAAVRGCRGCPWGQRGGAKGATLGARLCAKLSSG